MVCSYNAAYGTAEGNKTCCNALYVVCVKLDVLTVVGKRGDKILCVSCIGVDKAVDLVVVLCLKRAVFIVLE